MAEDPHSTPGDPPSTPGERRLARPPSERYRAADPDAPTAPGSRARGLLWGGLTALGGAAAITLAGGLVTITAGLLVIAAVIGWATAVAVNSGEPDADRRVRTVTAVMLALLGITLGQVGLWLLGREEGGVLGLTDYLAETFGVLVPLELAIGGAVAWWRAR